MADYGLISGLAQGLQSGLSSYKDAKKQKLSELELEDQKRQRAEAAALQQKQYRAGLFEKGVQEKKNIETGEVDGYELTPEEKEKRQFDRKYKEDLLKSKNRELGIGGVAKESQLAVNELSKKNASKAAIANQIDSVMKAYNDPNTSDDQRVSLGSQLLKTLNSTEGADAIGAEEAKRLGSFLEFKMFNVKQPGSLFGRDLDEFSKQAANTSAAIKRSVLENQKLAERLKSGRGFEFPEEEAESLGVSVDRSRQMPGSMGLIDRANASPLPPMLKNLSREQKLKLLQGK